MEPDQANTQPSPNLGYRDGMGVDEELQIGGMKTENNQIVENSQPVTT